MRQFTAAPSLSAPSLSDSNTVLDTPASKPARKSRKKPEATAAAKPARKSRTVKPAPSAPAVGKWAHGYVALAGAASCGLNALANVQHAPAGYAIPAAALGIFVPVAVLLLGRTAGLLFRAGFRPLAYCVGSVAAVVLALSVVHCAASVALLTGSHWLLSAALAVGVDCGMIGCEVAATLVAPAAPAPQAE
jgi:hypothetical protein